MLKYAFYECFIIGILILKALGHYVNALQYIPAYAWLLYQVGVVKKYCMKNKICSKMICEVKREQ